MKIIKKGCALVRISSVKQDTFLGSLEQQKNRINRFIKEQSEKQGCELKIVDWIDETTSGQSANTKYRESLFKLKKMIETKVITFVVMEKLDRLSRDSSFNIDFMRLAQEYDCDIYDVDSGGKVDMMERGSRMAFHVKNMVAEDYSLELSEKKTKKQREAKVNNGKDHTCQPILGIDPHPTKAGIYVINEEEKKIANEIYEKFSKTGSIKATLEHCHKKKFKRKVLSVKERRDSEGNLVPSKFKGGKPFDAYSLAEFLKSTKIRGEDSFKDTYNQFPKMQDENGYVKWKYAHGMVLDAGLIADVDYQLKEIVKKKKKEHKRIYLLSGILLAKDGSSFYGEPAKSGGNIYYFNSKYGLRLPQPELDKLIIGRIFDYLSSSKSVVQVFENALKDKDTGISRLNEQVRVVSASVNDLEIKLENLSKALLEVVGSGKEDIIGICRLIEDEKNKLTLKHDAEVQVLDNLKNKQKFVIGQFANQQLSNFIQKSVKGFEKFDVTEKKAVIQRIIKNIIIDPDDLSKIEVQLRPDPLGFYNPRPFLGGEKVRERGEWWDQQDLNL